jgi:chromate transport protein ChrA
MRINNFLKNLFAFLRFLIIEPIKEANILFHETPKIAIKRLKKPKTWFYMFGVTAIILLYYGYRKNALFAIIAMLVCNLWWEWERGYWKKLERDREIKRLEKKLVETKD